MYLDSIGLSHDPYLESFTRSQRNRIIGAFAMALRQGRYSGKAHDTLASGTIRNTISDVSSTFWENGRPNPTKDKDLQLSFILQQQFRAFKNKDPKEKQQKAIPACVIAEITKQQLTNSAQSRNSQSLPSSLPCVMRICQSPTTGKTTNGNPLPSEPLLLQKRSTHRPQRPITGICRLCDDICLVMANHCGTPWLSRDLSFYFC